MTGTRAAPEFGYDFEAKGLYRRSLWRRIAAEVMPGDTTHALLMPSSEGIEIKEAVRSGFHESNLHVVDRNPAIVANLKRRFPEIQTYGVTASRACDRVSKRGIRLAAANFDFTQPMGDPLQREIEALAAGAWWAATGVIAFTMLRGREAKASLSFLDNLAGVYARAALQQHWDTGSLTTQPVVQGYVGVQEHRRQSLRDWGRMMWVTLLFSWQNLDLVPIKYGIYRSTAGTQTMLWTLYRFELAAQRPAMIPRGVLGLSRPQPLFRWRMNWLQSCLALQEQLREIESDFAARQAPAAPAR